ncbi:hypothetical protein VJ309_004421 [Salmonella enterica]|nr:hypothetical protein [Salmonella enterica subsp. diarizonae]EAM7365978.1 hypothetical protein [Salmonella enterica]EBH8036879.1 hypothetical protein [Salmonella bongori]EAS6962148.1 hypothetical protein [Salmonella enterica]EBG7686575.1 hypothetical protein [Salmonella enterica]
MHNEVYIDLNLGLNPFLSERELTIEIQNKKLVVSRASDLIEMGFYNKEYIANIVHRQEVDVEEFIKLYASKVKDYFELTKSAYKVFLIFLHIHQMVKDKDYIYLSCKKAISFSENLDCSMISESIFYRGVKELIDKKIVAKTNEKNWYFINPSVVFNGERTRFVTEIIKKKDEINVERSRKGITKYDAMVRSRYLENVIDGVYK